MIRLRRKRFIAIAITSERGGNQSSVASAKRKQGAAAMPQLLFSFSLLFFTTFDVASHAPAFIGYSVERRQLNLSSATSIQILIMYRLFIIHPPFSFVLCVLGVFHRIIASIMTHELDALDDLIELSRTIWGVYDVPEVLVCQTEKTTQSHKLLHSA